MKASRSLARHGSRCRHRPLTNRVSRQTARSCRSQLRSQAVKQNGANLISNLVLCSSCLTCPLSATVRIARCQRDQVRREPASGKHAVLSSSAVRPPLFLSVALLEPPSWLCSGRRNMSGDGGNMSRDGGMLDKQSGEPHSHVTVFFPRGYLQSPAFFRSKQSRVQK